MEELLSKLLSTLQVPSIVLAISAIVFKLITFLPVTFVTAQEIERKIYTKEQRLLHQTLHFLFNMIVVTIIMFPLGNYFANNPEWYVNGVALFAVVLVNVFFLLIFLMADQRKKITNIVKIRNRIFLLLGTVLYLLITIALPPYFTGSLVGTMYRETLKAGSFEYFVVLIVFLSFCSTFVVLLLKPLNKVLAFKTEKVVSIEMVIDEKKEKWFLLYPIKTDSYLLGDHYMPEICKRNRIIKKDALFEKEFIIENLDDLREGPNKKQKWIQL
ncbi:hypothetical protein [Brevibacillus borstelensis]|uniref:hypothetical protein n=1 Tax=Brevibacillus borstelensis TaxID=45462 RepID=UPI0030FAA5E4